MSTIIRMKSLFKLQCFEGKVIEQLGIDIGELSSVLRKPAFWDLVSELEETSFESKEVKEKHNAKGTKTASSYEEMLELSAGKQVAKLKLESMKAKKSK